MGTRKLYRGMGLATAIALGLPMATPIVQAASPVSVSTNPSTARVALQTPLTTPYNLGEATLIQNRFPEDSRFREMPVRLNGLIGVSPTPGPHPVVVILHGTHPGCPVDEMDIDRWPCDPEVEQPNYEGFDYLVEQLAAQGYVALSLNINAENTFGFGEPDPGERLSQLIDLHLSALAIASGGGENVFGVDLAGQVDLNRMVIIGHSRGGEAAYWLAHRPDFGTGFGVIPQAGETLVDGIFLMAPASLFVESSLVAMPMGVLLPACDADVNDHIGQRFYEQARLAPDQQAPALSIWLEQANHNNFNTVLRPDRLDPQERPDCETLLSPEAQQDFLVDYTTDFLTTVFSADARALVAANDRLGLDNRRVVPDELYQQPARIASLVAAPTRQTVMVPVDEPELTTHRLGGEGEAQKVTLTFCPSGFYIPAEAPGSEPCRRVNLSNPGQPALAVASWWRAGAAWRFTIPAGAGDLSQAAAISLRAAIDPLSPLNPQGQPQSFSVQLTDGAGRQAMVATARSEPALQYPPGLVTESEFFTGGLFSGPVPLTTIRLPIDRFSGVNLGDIREVAIVFDRAPSGALFMADLEWVEIESGSNQ